MFCRRRVFNHEGIFNCIFGIGWSLEEREQVVRVHVVLRPDIPSLEEVWLVESANVKIQRRAERMLADNDDNGES